MEGMHTPPSSPVDAALRERIRAWLVLAALGLRLRHAPLVERLGGPEQVLRLPLGELGASFDVRGFRGAPPDGAFLERASRSAEDVLRWLEDGGGRVRLPHEMPGLRELPSFPLVLFERGGARLLGRRPALAIVGSRAASSRGLARARAIAEAAARAGVLVVSGGARGIDLAAHEAALSAGGETVVVLGDPIRPRADERPARVRALETLASGAERLLTLTPHGPWAPRDKRLWASRNAIIAALSDAVVVIEGRARSGTVYTAEAARRLARPVLAVPGDPDDEAAAAPNALLAEGHARPLLRLQDALAAVLDDERALEAAAAPTRTAAPARSAEEASLGEAEREVLRAIGLQAGAELDVESLALSVRLSAAERSMALMSLELSGWVERVGAVYRRVR